MRSKLRLFFGVLVVVFLAVFGTGILNNIHNSYLRLLSNWTVKLTNRAGTSGATGFVVRGDSGQKYIMTNGHVCDIAENGVLIAHYRGEDFPVSVYSRYAWNDLCALKAHRDLGPAVHIAFSTRLGESAWVIGHPLLEPRSVAVGELSGPTTVSIITKLFPKDGECNSFTEAKMNIPSLFGDIPACVRTVSAIAGTISIAPGNSGSPTVNVFGSVIAVAFASSTQANRSYFVPLSDLKDFLREL